MANIPKTMRAVGLNEHLPIDNPSSLLDLVIDVPTISGREILVQIKANGVNPADYKLRREPGEFTAPKVLGFDAAGVVAAVGPDVTLFKVGDEVYYVGPFTGLGANAEYQAVDERLVALKPSSLTFAEAAALPVTTLTAYDSIFYRLGVSKADPRVTSPTKKAVLILNGSGGVGSIAIQLLKELTDVTVIASASRPQSSAWVTELGADHVVNHAEDIPKQLAAIGIPQVDYILVFTDLPPHFTTIAEVIKPQGKICAITPITEDLPFQNLFFKSITFVWETLATRMILDVDDRIVHHRVLTEVRELVDAKRLRSIVGEDFGVINAANLKKAHAALEGGHVVGKIVLSGF
ncbi:unnamed protein product [Aphanomyces euteiches]|uniref:Enoyl reductase (ER) domain-containing protein n=1 Tax=Aphanomyces euteiches TaxID=100861 RepID=A0A6G0WLB5_9STRA|nr:hypothetical protein Ae201684_013914 [Aphanomyces euteiches]KAF0728108.1 hypothetical protein Ae201684_013936 [Aphanomyces euteiches]KAH9082937.1 hypothetical protein Ae201684P_013840 [Aphanomyces euteiches]KAH9083149.1 hypothetical protein Ae201684P_014046 [Aphanomyces euteiches]